MDLVLIRFVLEDHEIRNVDGHTTSVPRILRRIEEELKKKSS